MEDDLQVREMLASILSLSFYLLVAGDASEAIEIIAGWQVDLLLTDIVMPGMNGFELAEHATSMRPKLRVIYMTGYSDQLWHPTQRRHGRIIPKPFRPAEMVTAIKSALAV